VSRVTGALHGVRVTFVDTTDLAKVRAAITPATRMLHMETPSNPMMRITDVRALAALLRSGGGGGGGGAPILLSIDSTMMSPILQRPIALGADIVVHSATKFFGGHSDVMGGLVCLRDADLSKRIAFFQNAEGSGLDPQSCWLFMRGIKTLALRVERAQETAMEVARFLAGHARVKRLYFPGMPPRAGDDAAAAARCLRDNEVHRSQSRGSGCVMSFETGEVAISRRFIDSLRIFKLTVSFGSVNSLCEMPCMLSHASIPADQRTLPDDLVRLSIGIEAASDIIADISQAFELAQHPHVVNVRSVRRRDTQDEKELFRLASLAAAAAAAAGAETPETPLAAAAAAVGGAGAAVAATLEDAAAVSRAEVRKLQTVVRFLKERLAESEEFAADVRARLETNGASMRPAKPAPEALPPPQTQPLTLASLLGGAGLVAACAIAAALAAGSVGALRRR
jgi:cystathionine beta-lyase/cystathionine gamma-synthase